MINATPLIALEAVVVDTETTGLQPRTAFIVELGAVRVIPGQTDLTSAFRSLVRPSNPIPASSTAIHGIDDERVAAAPSFREIWPAFLEFVDNSVMIGHALGFDLAVLQHECERSGIAWEKPVGLDTQMLAQVAEPGLASYSLEQVASWLDVELADRHSALGDALTTTRVFRALIPRLRDRHIRTLGEAIQASRSLSEAAASQHLSGWSDITGTASQEQPVRALDRFDSYPYRHRVRDVMSAPPKVISGDATLSAALSRMAEERSSSLFVSRGPPGSQNLPVAETGIITERDVLRALALEHGAALSQSVDRFASRPLAVVPADAFVYRAVGRMHRLQVRHLGVVDNGGAIIGALSARDLLRLRASDAISLGDEIDQATTVHKLARAWAKLPHVAASLLSEGVPSVDIAAVISRELGALTRQAAVLAEQTMRREGKGGPPCAYSVAVLGSAGRGESLLAMDQDNALIFERGEPDGPEDRWFAEMSAHIADGLHEVGVPYCRGGVMAKNPQWRGSLETWRDRIAHWVTRSSPTDLLAVDIFFDLRGVHGANAQAETLWRDAFEAANAQAGFAKLLAEAAGSIQPGLSFFGGIKTSQGRIDLKKTGLFGIVTTARVLAIRHHVLERATPRRLEGILSMRMGSEDDLMALLEAHAVLVQFILSQQLEDMTAGKPPTYLVEIKRLSRHERKQLQAALQAVQHLDDLARSLVSSNRMF